MSLLGLLFISLGINAFLFIFASVLKTDRFTDFSYSLSFFALAAVLLPSFLSAEGGSLTALLLAYPLSVGIWALRLGIYLVVRIHRMGRDTRFDGRREHLLPFMAFWGLQALTVWIVMLPLWVLSRVAAAGSIFAPGAALPGPGPNRPAGLVLGLVLGLVVAWAGLIIESMADAQKFRFKCLEKNSGDFIRDGLWKYSRHPNYFGEMLFWWGLGLGAAFSFSGWQFLSLLGPLHISLMLRYVSGVPLLEAGARQKWGSNRQWQDYVERTSLIVPLPPRRKGSPT